MYGLPIATSLILSLTMVSSIVVALTLRPCEEKWGGKTWPSLLTTSKTITNNANLLYIIIGTSVGVWYTATCHSFCSLFDLEKSPLHLRKIRVCWAGQDAWLCLASALTREDIVLPGTAGHELISFHNVMFISDFFVQCTSDCWLHYMEFIGNGSQWFLVALVDDTLD